MAIKGNEIIEDDYLKNPISQTEKLIAELTKLDQAYKNVAKSKSAMVEKNSGQTAKEINQLNAEVANSTKLRQSADAVNKQLAASQKALTVAYSAENTQIQRNKAAIAERNKALREIIKGQNTAKGSLNEMRQELIRLTKQWDNLSKSERENAKTGGRLMTDIKRLRGEVGALEQATGRAQRNVGNYGAAFKGVIGNLKNFALALGVVGGVRLLTNVIRDAFNVFNQYDSAIASLAAITGLSGEKLNAFTNKVKEVATSTRVSATEVAKAFELIASAQPKLLKNADALGAVTEQAIILNKAIKGDLAETSLALVGVMNQFGLEASESARIINVLAAGSQAGAAP